MLWRGADFQPGRWKNPQFFWENQGDVGIMNVEIKINRDARKFIMFILKLDIENPIIRINTAFKGCSSLEKISVLPRIYHN
ncbi:hypothetical protein [Merdimmobilis hominis]|uniref:hypothetical protein n=1 Tax=Merdimmobilis hominis TaxID=2897707 RepID=UPI0032D4E589